MWSSNLSLNKPKQPVLSGVETKEFDPNMSTRDATLLLGFPHNYVAKHLILFSHSRLKSLPMSPCSSLCTASSAFMLTQLQAFSLCCGVHVIVLNWVWQNKNGNPSSPKQADFSRCFHWQDWSWLHGHNHKCNAHHSFFSTPLITGLWARLHSSVTVWTDIWEYCCPSPFYFWLLLTHFALFYSVLLQRRPPILLAVRMMTSLKHNMHLMFPQRLSLFWIFSMTMKKRALQSRKCINFGQICTPPFTFRHLHPVPTITAKGR